MESISLISFLRNYYGIVNQSLKANKLTHIDMKVLFPNIKRTSFEHLQNDLSLAYNGNIILVYDCRGIILPYLNPKVAIMDSDYEFSEIEEIELIDITKIDLNALSKEELLRLRKKLKRNCQYHDEKIVVNLIRSKKDRKTMQYKKEKRLLRMED